MTGRQARRVWWGAAWCLGVGLGCSTTPTDVLAAPPMDRHMREARTLRDTLTQLLAEADNQQRMDRLLTYERGTLTEADFWRDGWNAVDPVEGKLGVVGCAREPQQSLWVLGVAHPASLDYTATYAGPGYRTFARTVAQDRQDLLDRVRVGEHINDAMLPPPLSFRVTQTEETFVWTPSTHDIPLFEVLFTGGTLRRVEQLY